MFQNQFQNFGLTKTQSATMDYLLEHSETKASDIAKDIRHPRGVVYKALEELLALELVEKIEKTNQIARFRATHPQNLEKVLETKERELGQNKKILEEILPNLVSNYNLTLNKPGIMFYEGEDGMRKVLEDSLKSQTEICLFMNMDAATKESAFNKVNDEYVPKRIRAGIAKKIIEAGKKPELTFGTSNEKYDALTQIRYIEKPMPLFKSALQIYDGKISYQIFDDKNIISILIQDKSIYEMHKAWFDLMWENLSA
jgi:sugar-specific transcriptional regulator TrmB